MRSLFIGLAALVLWPMLAHAAIARADDTPARQTTDPFVIGHINGTHELDPAINWVTEDQRIIRGLYETLVVLGDDGVTLEAGGAVSWEVSDDGLTYTFRLRDDACWSDGTPVTAEDFVAGWFRALLPETETGYFNFFFVIDGAEAFYDWRLSWWKKRLESSRAMETRRALSAYDGAWERFTESVGVEALDARTLRVTLARPAPYFPYMLTIPCFAPMPSRWLARESLAFGFFGGLLTDETRYTDPDRVLCNGPYRLAAFEAGGEIALVANEHYWDAGAVKTPRLTFRVYAEAEAMLDAYGRGEIDWVPAWAWPEHHDALLAEGRGDVHLIQNVGTYYYEFNCQEQINDEPNPFADRRVRLAFALAIDRAALCELVGGGRTPLGTFVPPGAVPGYDAPDEAAAAFDLEAAAQLLAEAGYPGGEGLGRVDLLVNTMGGAGGVHVEVAEILRDVWQEGLGLAPVGLDALPFREYLRLSEQGHFHVRRAGWFGDYHDPTTFLDLMRSGSANNHAGYANEAFDTLMEAADAEVDPAARLALLREAEALLLQDAVVVPIYRYATVTLFDPERVEVPLNDWMTTRLEHLAVVEE